MNARGFVRGTRRWNRGGRYCICRPVLKFNAGMFCFIDAGAGLFLMKDGSRLSGWRLIKKEVRAECLLGRSTASILRFGHYHQHYNWGGEEKGFGLLFVCGSPAVHKELSPITYHWDTDRFSGEAEFLMCPCDIRLNDVIHYQYLKYDPPTKE